jgi:RNA polymerase sigma-70 factor (ECF subfamily)
VKAAIDALPENQRMAVILARYEDMSYDEIAMVLDVSIGTVKSRILRGREALRKILEERLEPETAIHWSPQPVE